MSRSANVFIATFPHDMHAAVVAHALKQQGHNVIRWFGADFPTLEQHSISISNSRPATFSVRQELCKIALESVDVVWYRRPSAPYISPDVPRGDEDAFVRRELQLYSLNMFDALPDSARWINPRLGAWCSNSKLRQLRVARDENLRIPDTIITNSSQEARRFVEAHPQGAIYKPFMVDLIPGKVDSPALGIYTSRVTSESISASSAFSSCANILQEEIPKAFEVRALLLEDRYYAIRINSQEHEKGRIDWRLIPTEDLQCEAHEMPESVVSALYRVLKRLGVLFASADLIVTPTGEYVFLEINEQGQFLFLEQYVPKLPILDTFCRFLTEEFGENLNGNTRIHLADILKSQDFRKQVQCDQESHVIVPQAVRVLG